MKNKMSTSKHSKFENQSKGEKMNPQSKFKKNRLFIILGLVLFLLGTSATWVFAQAVSGDGTIYACMNPSDGTIRIVSDQVCKKNERLLSWNIMGPKGDKGDPGPAGPEGPAGKDGATGPAGPAGTNGLACWDLNGNGIQDAVEDTNQDGKWDAADCKGEQGPQGIQGVQGEAGPEGPVGPIGQQGEQGLQGPQGPAGTAGSGIASLDELEGLPCNVGQPGEGVVALAYNPTTGDMTIKCTPLTTFYTLTVLKSGNGSNSMITTSPAGISCGTTCSYSFPAGSVIDLAIDLADGELFETWGGVCSGAACQVTMNAETTVEAIFQSAPSNDHYIYLYLEYSHGEWPIPDASGHVTVNNEYTCYTDDEQPCGPYTYQDGQTVTFEAIPDNDIIHPSIFLGWNGLCEGVTSTTCTVTLDSTYPHNLDVVAEFGLSY